MLKNYFLSFSLLATASAFSQITITSADMPNAGDSVKVSVTNAYAGTDVTMTGPNYTWNYAGLIPDNQRYEKFDSPSTFPSIYAFIFSPLNTSYGKNNYQNTGTIFPGLSIDVAYDFFKESTSKYRQVGAAYTINGTPIPFLYSKPDTIYEFPVNYLNVDSCDYKFGLGIPTYGYYGQKGHRVNEVDGWGSITTPFGTFDALRVKSTVTTTDTIYTSAFMFGTNIPRPAVHQYKWLVNGLKIPLLEIDETAGTVTNVVYIDSVRAEVPQVGITEYTNNANLAVYPNPATDQVLLQFNMSTSSNVNITISNALGQLTTVAANRNFASGKQSMVLNVKELGLSPGIYYVIFENGNSRDVKKVVIAK